MTTQKQINIVKQLYPLLYFACHGAHDRSDGLTERDLRILHHLNGTQVYASQLAKHLGLARSTLSAALTDLASRGLIERQSQADSRRKLLTLSAEGKQALLSNEGLSSTAIEQVLDRLTQAQRIDVISGLRLLAEAVRSLDE